MREIKFRVWRPAQKYFAYNAMELSELVEWNGFNSDENGIWSQYTGLKDRNGKEIYEGDLVLLDYKPWGGPEKRRRMFEVRYSEEFAAFEFVEPVKLAAQRWMEPDDVSDIEVVGNVHENPELLPDGR